MSKLFLTSDTHFFHKNIIAYCDRPFPSVEKMNESMILYWNEIVKPKDIVIHCGDFSMGGSKQFEELIYRLNGKILLIRGNHDRKKSFYEKYSEKITLLSHGFKFSVSGMNFILSHKPIEENLLDSNAINLHGHIHSKNNLCGPRHFDVGVDANNYRPIEIELIVELLLQRYNFMEDKDII